MNHSIDQQNKIQYKSKLFHHYNILFQYQNPGKLKKIKNIDTQILKCILTDQNDNQTLNLSFPRRWLSIEQLSLVDVVKKILNILNDYINSQYDDDHIQQIYDQSFQSSQKILNKPTDPEFIKKIHKNIITLDQSIIDIHHPHCGICQEPLNLNEKVVKLPCHDGKKETPHFFHTDKNKNICLGIKPWLKNNNSCPVCRFQLPYKKKKENIENNIQNNIENNIENNIQNNIENNIENNIQNNIENNIENEIEIDPLVEELIFERDNINEQEIIIIFSMIDNINQNYQPCENPQCDLEMCLKHRETKKIDKQEEMLLDEAIRLSFNDQNNQIFLDQELIQEQQQLFDQSEQDYIDQIIQMSVLESSSQNNKNPFASLQEQESNSPTSIENNRDDRQSPLPSSDN
jgi:hypothetical protein